MAIRPLPTGPEFSSQRMFMPAPTAPRRVEAYLELLNLFGLQQQAQKLALDHLALQPGESLLHAGCGNGNITLELKRQCPQADVTGLDADVQTLKLAADRAEQAGLKMQYKKGFLQDIPDAAERHDVVLCALFLYRLRGQDRGDALEEFQRVLKPGGRVLVIDFGAPVGGLRGWLVGRLARYQQGISDQLELGLSAICEMGQFHAVTEAGVADFGLRAVRCVK